MNLTKWMHRIGNVRKRENSKKPIEYQLSRVHEEVFEMSKEVRKKGKLTKVVFKKDDDGIRKPEGFIPEWGDAMAQLLHIADLVGFDPNEALEMVTSYHEQKRAKNPPKKKGKK